MDLKDLVMLAFRVSILSTVFGFGLRATSSDLLYLGRRPGLLLRSVIAVFVIMPIVAVVLARVFDFRRTVEIALVAIAVSPVPPLLPLKKAKAGGQTSYALGLVAILALLSIVVVPLSVEVLGRVFGRSFAMAPSAVARIVLMSVLLPLCAGMAVRARLPVVADRIEKPVDVVTRVLLPLAVLALVAGSWSAIWAAVGDGAAVPIAAFVAIGLLVGHLMAGPDPHQSVVLALSSAMRHPAIALSIASANFPDERFGGTILLCLIIDAIVGIPYLAWHRRQTVMGAGAPTRSG